MICLWNPINSYFFGHENVTNQEPKGFREKNSKFVRNENLFLNKVIGKLGRDFSLLWLIFTLNLISLIITSYKAAPGVNFCSLKAFFCT